MALLLRVWAALALLLTALDAAPLRGSRHDRPFVREGGSDLYGRAQSVVWQSQGEEDDGLDPSAKPMSDEEFAARLADIQQNTARWREGHFEIHMFEGELTIQITAAAHTISLPPLPKRLSPAPYR